MSGRWKEKHVKNVQEYRQQANYIVCLKVEKQNIPYRLNRSKIQS